MAKLLFDSSILTKGYKQHKDYFSDRHYFIIIDRYIEEAGELTKELLKHKRGRTERNGKPIRETIVEEFCDTIICLEFLARKLEITEDELTNGINTKIIKMLKNIEEGRA